MLTFWFWPVGLGMMICLSSQAQYNTPTINRRAGSRIRLTSVGQCPVIVLSALIAQTGPGAVVLQDAILVIVLGYSREGLPLDDRVAQSWEDEGCRSDDGGSELHCDSVDWFGSIIVARYASSR